MKFLKHAVEQPFVLATGAAALVHSTWALGTLFSGKQPDGVSLALLGWLVPAFLIAFALDVGQIATSVEIRSHGMTTKRGITFFVFAAATYYLQWLYIAHHMPSLPLADGVRESWKESATTLRDAAVWIIPALLPLSTLLYTFSAEAIPADSPAAPPAPAAEPSTALAVVEQVEQHIVSEQVEQQITISQEIENIPIVLVDDTEEVIVNPTPRRPRSTRRQASADET
jgi:hypothetical protein